MKVREMIEEKAGTSEAAESYKAAAIELIEELVDFVRHSDCRCFDEYGNKLPDCDRCELLKKYDT
jgi:hypothetical protein